MSRDWRLYLEDMLQSCAKVMQFTAGMSQESFVNDVKTYDATVRNLEIIGEAAKRVPLDVQQQMPDIQWRKVAGFRDVLAHAYFGIDNDILWDVARNEIPRLEQSLRRFLEGDNGSELPG